MDIKCVVCGEPWDAYGVSHGDMEKWEADLFKKGAGCPSCEGVDNGFEVKTLADIENGDGDPAERLNLNEDKASRPKWEKPKPKLIWTCDACGCGFHEDEDEDAPEPTLLNDCKLCDRCVEHCDECGKELCSAISHDPYDGASSFFIEGETFCIDCYDSRREEDEAREREAEARRLSRSTYCNDGLDVEDAAAILDVELTTPEEVERIRLRWNRRPCDPRAMVRYMKGK